MTAYLLEHVVEETEAGGDVATACTVEVEGIWMSVSLVTRLTLARRSPAKRKAVTASQSSAMRAQWLSLPPGRPS